MIQQSSLEKAFLSAPGDDLVDKLIMQMQSVPAFAKLFPPEAWANYARMDWPVSMLPAINIFESGTESKDSDNWYLNGTIQIQVYWPADFRRSDLARVPAFFKGVLENFFNSKYTTAMLDESASVQRPCKVAGLNFLGKTLNWTPQVEGITSGELVPVSIVDVQYRISLQAWDRYLEFVGRTKDDPFEFTLYPLTVVGGEIEGVNNDGTVAVTIEIDDTINED